MVKGKKVIFNSLISMSIMLTIFCFGCMGLVGSAVISSFPTFQETVDGWPKIDGDKGRAIFYYVKQEGSGIVGPSVASIKINNDNKLRASFSDRTFVFADLAEGSHTVELKCAPFRKCKNIGIQVKKGEVLYIKVDNDAQYYQTFQIIEKDDALKELESLHHNFKKPLSIYYQPKPL